MSDIITILACSILLLVLAACGGGGGGSGDPKPVAQNNLQLSTSIPPSLQYFRKSALILTSDVRIDNGTPIDLSVDLINMLSSGDIDFLSDGEYTFELRFSTELDAAKVPVAHSDVLFNLIDGNLNNIVFPPYIYFDDDGDGFTNLAELSSGTAWNDVSDKPLSDYSRYSANYITTDKMVGNVTNEGTVIAGNANSANYQTSTLR